MAGSQTTRLLTPPVSPQNSRLLSPRTPNSSEVQQFAKLRYSSTVEKNEAVLKAGRLSSASTSPNKATFRRAQDKENSRSPGTSEASPIKGEFSPQAQLDARETVLLAQKLRTAEAALDEERALGDREREVLRDRLRFSESQDEAARDRLAAALASLRAQNSELQDSALQAAEEDKEKEADFQKFRTLQETELQQARDEAKRALQEARQANAERDRLAASLRKCNEDEAAVKEAGRLELTRVESQLRQTKQEREDIRIKAETDLSQAVAEQQRLRLEVQDLQRKSEISRREAELKAELQASQRAVTEAQREAKLRECLDLDAVKRQEYAQFEDAMRSRLEALRLHLESECQAKDRMNSALTAEVHEKSRLLGVLTEEAAGLRSRERSEAATVDRLESDFERRARASQQEEVASLRCVEYSEREAIAELRAQARIELRAELHDAERIADSEAQSALFRGESLERDRQADLRNEYLSHTGDTEWRLRAMYDDEVRSATASKRDMMQQAEMREKELLNELRQAREHRRDMEISHDAQTAALQVTAAKEKELSAERLTSQIEELGSKQVRLQGDIEAANKSKIEAEEAMEEASALRKKESDEHFALEQSLVKSITSLKNALVMLSKYSSFSQMPPTVLLSIKTVLRDLAMKHELLTGEMSPSSSPLARRVRTAFLSLTSEAERSRSQSESERLNRELLGALDVSGPGMTDSLPVDIAERFLAQAAEETGPAASAQSFLQVDREWRYKPKSGSLIESLEKMLQDMSTELKEARAKEAKADKAHKALLKAKDAELTAIRDGIDEYQSEAASTKRQLANAKEDLIQTGDTKEADGKFLQELKVTCEGYAKEYKARSHTRSEELKAVTEAMAILTEDDAREHLEKTVSLLQMRTATQMSAGSRLRRSRAAAALRSFADTDDESEDLLSAWHGRHIRPGQVQPSSPRTVLEMLAMRVELEPMPEVTKAMGEMIADLKTQQTEEVKEKASCEERAQQNKMDQLSTSNTIKDLKGEIESMDLKASDLDKEIKQAEVEKEKLADSLKKAEEVRKEERAESQSVILEQQKTQAILKQALDKLKEFYALVQTEAAEPAEEPEYEKHGASSAVMELLKQIIEDSEALAAESKKANEDGEAKFKGFKARVEGLDQQLKNTITTKNQELAQLQKKRAEKTGILDNSERELKSFEAAKAALDDECVFLVKNFELRQEARLKEIEGVQRAKAIILGMK